jgi:uncharacterized protein YcsI (UPF0317 family)
MVDRYTFRREFTDLHGQTKTVEHTVEGETLSEILEDFIYFLNGCSFSYLKDLIFVKEDGQEISVLDWEKEEPNTVEEHAHMSKELIESIQQLY